MKKTGQSRIPKEYARHFWPLMLLVLSVANIVWAIAASAGWEFYIPAVFLVFAAAISEIYTSFQANRVQEDKVREDDSRFRMERDYLTGLYNRMMIKELIENELFKSNASGAFLMLDLDNLKRINDFYGHDAGDMAIKTFAGALNKHFGNDSIIGRLGGDEFVAYVKRFKDEKALKARIRDFAVSLNQYSTGNMKIRCSIGVSVVRSGNKDFNILYKQADEAMYYAKKNGKNSASFYRKSFSRGPLKGRKVIYPEYTTSDYEELKEKKKYDFPDVFAWVINTCTMDFPDRLLVTDPHDFLMLVNPDTNLVEHIFTAGGRSSNGIQMPGKFSSVPYSIGEPYDGLGFEQCNRSVFTISPERSERPFADYIDMAKIINYNGVDKILHFYKYCESETEKNNVFVRNSRINNLLFSCMFTDIDPLVDLHAFFKRQIELICDFFDAECGYIIRMDDEMKTAGYNISDNRLPDFKMDFSIYAAENWDSMLQEPVVAYIQDIENVRDVDIKAYEFFKNCGVNNLLIVPIWDTTKVYGYICLRNISRYKNELSIPASLSVHYRTVMQRLVEQVEIERSKYYDGVTGYLNFDGFKFQLNNINLFENGKKFALCAWDLRSFKDVNEIYGYDTGNRVIKDVAEAFARRLADDEYLCRISADNFCAICRYTDISELMDRLNHVVDSAKTYFAMNFNGSIAGDIAMGIYCADENERLTTDKMLNMATIAEKAAKNEPGTRIVMYDDLRLKIEREIRIEQEMEQALLKKEFKVYIQPQMYIGDSLSAPSVLRAEALCRWIRDGKVFSQPSEFIKIFEKTGKIYALDMYMLENACELIRYMRENENVRLCLSINISRYTMLHSGFIKEYDEITRTYGIRKNELEIEFAEGIAQKDYDKFFNILDLLKKRGCICAIDDFGSDLSSLNILQRLPIDVLKLDKCLFDDGRKDNRRAAFIESTMDMAKKLNMRTIAEGIEDENEIESLKNVNCDYVQGYVYARPMPVDDYIKWAKTYV